MNRERLTITLDAELLQALDEQIDKSLLRNRSHAIEHLLKEGLGLHELTQAFVFADQDSEPDQLASLLPLFKAAGISQLFIGGATPDLLSVIGPEFTVQTVPADFGTGGALMLKKDLLSGPFVLSWLGPDLTLPQSLIPAYIFHRQHGAPLTQLVTSADAVNFSWAKLAIAQPELLSSIPAGLASLEETVFPELLKAGRVKTYAIRS